MVSPVSTHKADVSTVVGCKRREVGKSRARLLVLVTLAALIAPSSMAWGATRTETQEYTLARIHNGVACNFANSGRNFGGACFQIQSLDKQASITVTDDYFSPVYAARIWRNSSGDLIGFTNFCGSISSQIPSGAARLEVQINIRVPVGNLACGGLITSNTKGTVSVTFTT